MIQELRTVSAPVLPSFACLEDGAGVPSSWSFVDELCLFGDREACPRERGMACKRTLVLY